MSFTVVIPARYASTRLPAKPLVDIAGMPMIIRVIEQAKKSSASRIIVATDHPQIVDVIDHYGYEVILTSESHTSGTQRLAEVINKLNFKDDETIVNVQGDEPLIPPEIIDQVATNIKSFSTSVATLAAPITHVDEVFNPNVVKVIRDKFGSAIYFSRAAIPWDRDQFAISKNEINNHYLRHIGIYAYKAEFIRKYLTLSASPLEKIEMLEQLRVLWHGEKIHVDLAKLIPEIGVDTQEDLEKVRKFFVMNQQM